MNPLLAPAWHYRGDCLAAGLGSGWPIEVALMVLGRHHRHFEGAGEGAGDGAEALAVAGRGSPVRGGASLGRIRRNSANSGPGGWRGGWGAGRLGCWGAGRLGVLARLRSAWGPPGTPWSCSGGRSRTITRASTRPKRRDQGPVHDHGPSRGVIARPPPGRAGTAPVRVGAARNAVIMLRRVITEGHAGEHPPAAPGSRTSAWSRTITRVTARPPRPGNW